MPRSKSNRRRIIQQFDKAITWQEKVLFHLAAADCLGKGGSVVNNALYMPEGLTPEQVATLGHPLVVQTMPLLVNAVTGVIGSLKQIRSQL